MTDQTPADPLIKAVVLAAQEAYATAPCPSCFSRQPCRCWADRNTARMTAAIEVASDILIQHGREQAAQEIRQLTPPTSARTPATSSPVRQGRHGREAGTLRTAGPA